MCTCLIVKVEGAKTNTPSKINAQKSSTSTTCSYVGFGSSTNYIIEFDNSCVRNSYKYPLVCWNFVLVVNNDCSRLYWFNISICVCVWVCVFLCMLNAASDSFNVVYLVPIKTYGLSKKSDHIRPSSLMAEGREVVDFHQSYCKKPRIWPLDPSH